MVYREIMRPSHTAKRPAIILTAIYKNDIRISPLVPSLKDSRAKVEKVVKPPQNPTTSRAFTLGSMRLLRLKYPIKMPIKRHPIILIVKVASGKGSFHTTVKRRLTRNRQHVPKNPPNPAINKSLNIYANLHKKSRLKVGLG